MTPDEAMQAALTDPSGKKRLEAALGLGTATQGPNGAMAGLSILVTRRPDDGGFAVLFKAPGEQQPFGQYTPDNLEQTMALVASAVGLTVLPLTTDAEFAEWQSKNAGQASG